MKKQWSTHWNSSIQRRKQRKYQKNAPLHVRHKFASAPLSKELKEKYGCRNLPVRSGDTVTIKKGQFKGKTDKVSQVKLTPKVAVFVEGAKLTRVDGTEAFYPIHPSNVEITKLDTSDELRMEKIKQKGSKKKVEVEE